MSRRRYYRKGYKALPKKQWKNVLCPDRIFLEQIKILIRIRRGEGDSDSYLPVKIMVLYLLIFIGGESVPPGGYSSLQKENEK